MSELKPIATQAKRIDATLAKIEENLPALIARVQPVLSPDATVKEKSDEKMPAISSHAQWLVQVDARLESISERVTYLLDHLELE